jgi:hypothetical protein
MLGMKENETGVLIKKVNEYTAMHNVLKQNDVILKIEDYVIGIDGSIQFNSNARIGLSYILEKKKFGEPIKIEFLRDGKRQTQTVKLEKPTKNAVVDVYKSNITPSYYITSGFVFQKLSINYINQYQRLYRRPAYELVNLIDDHPEDIDEIIFIVSVLPDSSNEGYQNLRNIAIKEINGEKIKNFEDFISKLKAKRYAVLKDMEDNEIVIDNNLSQQRDTEIQKIYNISQLYSDDLKFP